MPNSMRTPSSDAHGGCINRGCGVPAGTGAPAGPIRDLRNLCYTALKSDFFGIAAQKRR